MSNRHIFTTSLKLEIFISCWKESYFVTYKILKFLMDIWFVYKTEMSDFVLFHLKPVPDDF